MLNASQEEAGEAVEPGEEQAAEQSAVDQEAEAAPEQEVVETMQQFISAAREVIDATNRAIYSVLEEKQQ
jgi:ADP-ribosylglycohydrolase